MNDNMIQMTDVVFRYGKTEALSGLNLEVPRGSVCGLLGRNGAGKTTAIKILAGLMPQDGGRVRVNGRHPWLFTPEEKQQVTYLSEQQILPPYFKVRQLLDYCRSWYPKWDSTLEARLLKDFRVDPTKRIKELSLGSQRKVGLILALSPKPALVLLDEPAGGLDAVVRREFLDQILEVIREEGRTVLFSSHILTDVERVADRVAIISKGKALLNEPIEELMESVRQVRFEGWGARLTQFSLPGAFSIRRKKNDVLATVRVKNQEEVVRLGNNFQCVTEVVPLNLEDLFIELVREEGEGV